MKIIKIADFNENVIAAMVALADAWFEDEIDGEKVIIMEW